MTADELRVRQNNREMELQAQLISQYRLEHQKRMELYESKLEIADLIHRKQSALIYLLERKIRK